jgi:hypothetical protein
MNGLLFPALWKRPLLRLERKRADEPPRVPEPGEAARILRPWPDPLRKPAPLFTDRLVPAAKFELREFDSPAGPDPPFRALVAGPNVRQPFVAAPVDCRPFPADPKDRQPLAAFIEPTVDDRPPGLPKLRAAVDP